ncbi:MAG: GNAT family N-acetyltransferase [Patescibacteria group bacterium]
MSVVIRPSTPNDAKAIYDINRLTWLETYPNEDFNITYADVSSVFSLQSRVADIENITNYTGCKETYCSMVAEVDSKIVGYAFALKDITKNTLKSLYILPEQQGRGLGSALLSSMDSWFTSTNNTYLTVAKYNVPAIKFYEKNKFKVTDNPIKPSAVAKLPTGKVIPEVEMVKYA